VATLVSPVGGAALVGALLLGVILGAVGHRSLGSKPGVRTGEEPTSSQSSKHSERLDGVAATLETTPNPDEVCRVAEQLRDAVDGVARAGELDGRDPADRARHIKQALERDRLTVITDGTATGGVGASGHEKSPSRSDDNEFDHVVAAAETAGRPESRTARRLVTYLEDPSRATEREFMETLETALDAIDERATIESALTNLPEQPEKAGTHLHDRLGHAETGTAAELARVGDTLAETARRLEACRDGRDRLTTAAETVCAVAADTGIQLDGQEQSERLEALARVLESGDASFGSSLTDAVDRAVTAAGPESILGQDLVSALRNPADNDIGATLRDIFEALDEAERVRSRLDNVSPTEITELARTVRSALSDETTVEAVLRDRVADIEGRVGDDRMLAFSFRQELNFYDKTLLPRLRAEPDDEDEARTHIEAARDRRAEMREQFPRQYDDLNHEIPIHLLDTVSDLLDEAEAARSAGNSQRALGVAQAADRLLDAVESLYRDNAYHILLRQLRE